MKKSLLTKFEGSSFGTFVSVALFFLLCLFCFQTVKAQNTLIVRSDGSGDYTTITAAIAAASNGDILDVEGTFTGEGSDLNGIIVNKNLTIIGPGYLEAIVEASSTEFDSGINKRVFTISPGKTVTLQGMTIQHGYVNTATNYDGGGGIKNSGTLTIESCVVTKNATYSSNYQFGGGILNDGSGEITILNSTISYNKTETTGSYGGGMAFGNYGSPGLLMIKNSTFNDNISYSRAGALLIMTINSTPENIITNCTFTANQASDFGAAIFNDRSNVTYTNNTIVGNINTTASGGGICQYYYTTTLKNNLIADNMESNTTPNDFRYQNGTVTDNGYNLIEYSSGNSFSATGDITGDQVNLNISSSLADNSTNNGTQTLELLTGSVAIDAGDGTDNGTVSIPCMDQRKYYTASTKDIGAFEYNGGSTPPYNIDITSQPSDSSVCTGASASFSVSTSNGTYFQWRKDGTNMIGKTSSTLSLTNVSSTDEAVYDCMVSDDCSSTYSGTATLTVTLTSVSSTTPASRCDAGTVTLMATSGNGTLKWYDVSTGGSSLGTGTSFITPSLTTTTTYYVESTSNNCTSARTAVTATINTTPTVSSTTPASHCDAGTVTLGASASAGTLNWYDVPTGGSSLGTGTSFITPSITTTTTYYVDATDNSCTSSRTAVTATINITPDVLSTTPDSRCDEGTVALGATASAGTLNWYAASSGGTSLGTGTSFTTPSISTTTTYYVDATDNGCTTTPRAAVTATVNETPTINGTTPDSRCDAGTVTLGATATSGTLNWYAMSTGGTSLGTGTTFTTTSISNTTTYYVDATDNGCTSARTAVMATVNTTPTVSSTAPDSRCEAGTVTIGATASAGTLNWYAASTGGISLGTGTGFITPSISATTTYYVDATDNGCTSSRTPVTATVNSNTSSTLNITACHQYVLNSTTYNTSGTFYQTIPNEAGCDSMITLELTINGSTESFLYETNCDSYNFNGDIYTTSGTYRDTLVNSVGCDSVITLYLTIHNSNTSTITHTACDSYTFDGNILTSSGTYTATVPNAAGCDSVITLHLTVNNSNTSTISLTECDSYNFNGTTLTSDGTYTSTVPNSGGCDSVITLHLTIHNSNTSTISNTVCDMYNFNGTILTSTGTYTSTIANQVGCDSVITLHLTVNNSNTSTITHTACDSYTFDGTILTSSGTYTATVPNAAGCDSVITLHLTVNNSNTSTISLTECDSYNFNGTTLTSDGTYTSTVPNSGGCDSVITLHLTIHNSNTSTITQTACDSYIFNGTTLTISGTFTSTVTNNAGCDSVITLHLTINTVDASATQNGSVLTANASGATYQWIDCDNGNTLIPGETNQVFTATTDGNYAVVVTQNGCTDTSACFTVLSLDINGNSSTVMMVYPNPNRGDFILDLGIIYDQVTVEIFSATGQLVSRGEFGGQNRILLNIDGASGPYMMKVNISTGKHFSKMIMKE